MGIRNLLLLTGFLALANQCPLEYGPAVFQAQAWIWSIDPMAWFTNPCETGDLNSGKLEQVPEITEQIADLLTVYPNPATDALHIEVGTDESVQSVRLVNALGVEVWSGLLESNGTGIIVTGGFPRGMYLLEMHCTSGVITKRVVLE